MRRLLLTLFLVWVSYFALQAEIIPIYSYQQIQEELFTERTLLFLDIDRTQLYPISPMLGTPRGRRYFLEHVPAAQHLVLGTKLQAATCWAPVEKEFPLWVRRLQESGNMVLGVTGRGKPIIAGVPYRPDLTPELGLPPDAIQFTLKQLADIDTDLTLTAPQAPELAAFCEQQNAKYTGGIIFLCQQPSANVQPNFIRLLQPLPERVVVIDDELYYLQLLEEAMQGLPIQFVAYHYRAAEKLDENFVEAIAAEELSQFLNR